MEFSCGLSIFRSEPASCTPCNPLHRAGFWGWPLAERDTTRHLSTGLPHRDFLTTDYHLFVQDDWKVSSKLTLNFGLRYELDPPAYESKGRIGGFDPALYRPNMEVDSNGLPMGPPAAGIVEAGNAPPQYSLPGVTRVGKRVVKILDPNNFGPRIGVAWSPLTSGRLALHAGYGIFYSRPSFFYLGLEYFSPPFFFDDVASGQPIENAFPNRSAGK